MSAQFQQLVSKVVTVTTAGAPVQISAIGLFVRSVSIQSYYLNTGLIFFGETSAHALSTTGQALVNPGDFRDLEGDKYHGGRTVQIDLSTIWINSSVSGEKAIVQYLLEVL